MKGCLVIFFTNFLALMIKAEVADADSTESSIYSVVLIMVNIMFFLSIWWNTWATMKATFSRRGFQVWSQVARVYVYRAIQKAHRIYLVRVSRYQHFKADWCLIFTGIPLIHRNGMI